MQEFLGSMPGLQSYESAANFILLRTGRKDALVGALRKDGILVRDVSAYPMLENCVRLSIGSQSENDRVCDSISRFFAADA
jgi:histidinol-phosphate aminotransferase